MYIGLLLLYQSLKKKSGLLTLIIPINFGVYGVETKTKDCECECVIFRDPAWATYMRKMFIMFAKIGHPLKEGD